MCQQVAYTCVDCNVHHQASCVESLGDWAVMGDNMPEHQPAQANAKKEHLALVA